MADDIFLSQEEQNERAKKWLKDNVPALAIGIGIGLAAIFGFNQYKANKLASAEMASGLYVAALNDINESEFSDINAQVVELKSSHPTTSYAAKAALLKAKQLSVSDLPAAVTELQWVVDNAPEAGLQHTARIRQAKIQLALGDYEAAVITATQASSAGFESHYSEILADISTKQGNFDKAREQYQQAIDSLGAINSGYARVLTLKIDRLPSAINTDPSDVEPTNGEPTDADDMTTDALSTEDSTVVDTMVKDSEMEASKAEEPATDGSTTDDLTTTSSSEQ